MEFEVARASHELPRVELRFVLGLWPRSVTDYDAGMFGEIGKGRATVG
jgi:hypothetical protein